MRFKKKITLRNNEKYLSRKKLKRTKKSLILTAVSSAIKSTTS